MQKSRWAPKAEEAEAPQTTTEKSTPPETTANATSQPPPGPAPVQYTTAPTVSMSYEPAYDDPSIDPFAQTASTDDLFFDDDITPIAEPVVEQNPLELQVIDAEYLPEDIAPPTAPQAHLAPHIPQGQRNPERGGRGRGRGRGARRGRGGGGGGGGHVGDIRELEKKEKEQEKAAKEAEAASTPAPATTAPEPATTTEDNDASATPDAPTEPKEKPTHSVRGDRTLTGGPARTRLTEAQLSAKLASMRSKNEALQTAHARAEADLANFEAREAVLKKKDVERKKVLAEKQKAERQNRQQMMGEREKNRLRKLNAQGGREWDFEKEEGFSAGVGGAGGRCGESELGGTRTGSWKGWERRQRWTW
ncbi:hypothetical protein HBI89_066200 [Parastagonospora nodorum]|nr:hypothetical protein HBI89_066200 [Parastagonospora nodorum]